MLFGKILSKAYRKMSRRIAGKVRQNRIQKEISNDLSPKFTEMKTGPRLSRFGRPQKAAKQDANSIPTEISKFVTKHSPSPKRNKTNRNSDLNLSVEQCEKLKEADEDSKENKEEGNIPKDLDMKLESNESGIIIEIHKEEPTVQPVITETVSAAPAGDVIKPDADLVEAATIVYENNKKASSEANSEDDAGSDTSSGEKNKDFSDTDSALGSAGSCHEMKPLKEGDIVAGSILWGSFNKANWYPCMAYPIDDEGNVTVGELFFTFVCAGSADLVSTLYLFCAKFVTDKTKFF